MCSIQLDEFLIEFAVVFLKSQMYKCFVNTIPKNKYPMASVVFVYGEEAWGCQKQSLNRSPPLKIIRLKPFRFLAKWELKSTGGVSIRIHVWSLWYFQFFKLCSKMPPAPTPNPNVPSSQEPNGKHVNQQASIMGPLSHGVHDDDDDDWRPRRRRQPHQTRIHHQVRMCIQRALAT